METVEVTMQQPDGTMGKVMVDKSRVKSGTHCSTCNEFVEDEVLFTNPYLPADPCKKCGSAVTERYNMFSSK